MMKKVLIFLLVMIMTAPLGFAQQKQKKEKQKKDLPTPIVEVWGGMGLSTVLGSLAITDKRLAGMFGAGFTMPLSKQNNLQFEGAYTFQGFKYKPRTFEQNDTVYNLENAEQRFNYFKITVQDRYFLDKKRTYYVNGGVYFAFLTQLKLQANYDVLIPGTEEEEHHEIDHPNKDEFKPFDFGIMGGVGVRLGNKALSCFTIEARVAYGLINIAKNQGDEKFNEKNFYGVLKLGIDIPTRP